MILLSGMDGLNIDHSPLCLASGVGVLSVFYSIGDHLLSTAHVDVLRGVDLHLNSSSAPLTREA